MTEFLLNHIKKRRGEDSPGFHSAVGRLAGITGIVCNCVLTAAKLAVGMLAGSVSVVADALNNMSDAASSAVTLIGFKLAARPADKDHPFGHARYEYLSGTVTAALILVIGAELALSSIRKIFAPESIDVTVMTIAVLTASIGAKLWLFFFYRKLGRRISSDALLACAIDSRNDVLASSAVLVGCAATFFFDVNIDGYVGLAVAVFILWSGIGIAGDAVSTLIGKRADSKLTERLADLITSHDKVLGIHDLLIHDYGPGQCYASVHVELCADEDALVCHEIIDEIEREADEKMNIHLVIHYDPVVENDEEQNEMVRVVEDIIRRVDTRFSMHDFRLARGAEQKKLVFDLSVPFAMLDERAQIKQEIDDMLAKEGRSYVTVIRFDGK